MDSNEIRRRRCCRRLRRCFPLSCCWQAHARLIESVSRDLTSLDVPQLVGVDEVEPEEADTDGVDDDAEDDDDDDDVDTEACTKMEKKGW